MKKFYETPLAEAIALVVAEIIAVSGTESDNAPGSGIGSGKVDTDESWADEFRGDWADIWCEM